MAKTKKDIPFVPKPVEPLIEDIKKAWEETSKWALPVTFFLIGMIVFWEVAKKRWLKRWLE